MRFGRGKFLIQNVVSIPSVTAGALATINFEGIYNMQRNNGTWFNIGANFPTGRYVFEAISAGGTAKSSAFTVRNINCSNENYAIQNDGIHNLGGGTSPLINAGFVKFESDSVNGAAAPFVCERCFNQYMWRGVHLVGETWYIIIRDFYVGELNVPNKADSYILLEPGTGHDASNGMPKLCTFEDVHISTISHLKNAVVLSGGYHRVLNLTIDGGTYSDCVVGFKMCFSTIVYSIFTEDLFNEGTMQSVYQFDTLDPNGNAGAAGYTTYNNQIYEIQGNVGGGVPSIKFINSPFRNYIRAFAYWGSLLTVNDAGAGSRNVIELIEGQQATASASTKITSTNNIIELRDSRTGAKNAGVSVQSGTGSATTFNIAHGLFTTPTNARVTPGSLAASASFYVTLGSTNITLTYASAPANATNNLTWYWDASVYP